MNLDVPTLFVVSILLSATLALAIGVAGYRHFNEGLNYWAAALGLHAVTYALFVLRGRISDVLSILVANILLSAVLALFAEGIFQFQRRRPLRWLVWTPVAVVGVVFSLFLDNMTVRVIVGCAIFAGQSLIALVVVLQRRRDILGYSHYILAAGLTLVATIFSIRAFATAAGFVDTISITSSGSIQSLTFLAPMVSLILVSIGFLMMTKDRADERNRELAFQDELTKLSNRRSILDALAQQVALAKRSSQPLTVLMIDIDHFKRINDTFGHMFGDKVLRGMAEGIRARLRTQDIAGRFGGEEFLVILPNTNVDGARQLAEVLRQTIAEMQIGSADGEQQRFTISIGVHQGRVDEDWPVEALIEAADQALYRAKGNGRNRVEVV